MIVAELIHVAWKSLLVNKLRSLLTMLGVIIGVAAVIVMISISAGTEAEISEAINQLGSNLVFIQGSMFRGGPGQRLQSGGLKMDDVAAIRERISGVAGVTVDQQTTAIVKAGNVTLEDITILGSTPDYAEVRDLIVGSGRFFTEQDNERAQKVAVLGSDIAAELFGSANPIGQTITVGNTKLAVIGVMEPKGLVSGTNFDEMVFVPIKLIFKKFMPSFVARFMGDNVRQITVAVAEDADMSSVIEQITILLAKRHEVTLNSLDFNVLTQEDIITTQESTTSSFRTLLAWVAGVSLIVGGIGIMNIMLVSVTERTREIGLRQALGATPRDIQIQFLSEALILSLLGGLIGVLAGIGGAILFGVLSDMRTVIVPYSIVLSFTSAAVVGIFFGFLPAQKAAQLDPIEALRHD
ncbi:MAG: FtsX-like permease family protein [Anaerolineae bacterium]|nr:FtsX-like permease family protein [Anaerolineae bacterium]